MKRRRLLHARRGKRVVSGEEFVWMDERGRGTNCVLGNLNFPPQSSVRPSVRPSVSPFTPPRLPPPPLSATFLLPTYSSFLKDATIVAPNSSPTTETNEAGLESETV
eukprot:scaffold145_cov195-Alexandrium_tamarense.AAC.26